VLGGNWEHIFKHDYDGRSCMCCPEPGILVTSGRGRTNLRKLILLRQVCQKNLPSEAGLQQHLRGYVKTAGKLMVQVQCLTDEQVENYILKTRKVTSSMRHEHLKVINSTTKYSRG
jgi:hypothetical protein